MDTSRIILAALGVLSLLILCCTFLTWSNDLSGDLFIGAVVGPIVGGLVGVVGVVKGVQQGAQSATAPPPDA